MLGTVIRIAQDPVHTEYPLTVAHTQLSRRVDGQRWKALQSSLRRAHDRAADITIFGIRPTRKFLHVDGFCKPCR